MSPLLIFLAVALVVTGSINTISTKYADNESAVGIDGTTRQFNHPFFQAAGMFVGEMLCMLAFWISTAYKKSKNEPVEKATFNPLIFLLPACCDLTATSCMYVGLTWTYASVFQMLRGSVIIFTGILSVIFLGRKLKVFHWTGMVLVLIGLGFVGYASLKTSGNSSSAPRPIAGDIIVIAAQIVVAVQMVVEEKFISKYKVPALQVVGWEGFFGFSVLSCLLVAFYFIPLDLSGANDQAGPHFENSLDAFVMMKNNYIITLAIGINMLSIAFFNFFGVSITKYGSATTRMVLDSIRTIVIWGYSLLAGWQKFQYFQLIGFSFLILGSLLYNEIIVLSCFGSAFTPDDKGFEVVQKVENEPLLSPTATKSDRRRNIQEGA